MLAKPFRYQQPYKGRWDLSCNDENVGGVKGDTVIGYVARDHLDRNLGSYRTSKEAMDAVVYAAEERVFVASWLLGEPAITARTRNKPRRTHKATSEPTAAKPFG